MHSSPTNATTRPDSSPDGTDDDESGASAAFYLFVGALALSVFMLLASLFFA